MVQAIAALGGAAALGSLPMALRAEPKGKIIVGTWSGDYARLLNKNIDTPIMNALGWEVVQDQAGEAQRRSKLLAEKRLPSGSTDLQGFSAANMYQTHAADVVAEIDYAQIPNAKYLLKSMRFPYGVGHIYSGKVAVYKPELIKTSPKGYKDVFNPKWGDKLAVVDVQYQYTLIAAALAAGGSITNLEPGKKLLLECKKAGMRIYPTNEAFAKGLQADECALGIMWKAQVVQWQKQELIVPVVTPAEGVIAYVSGFVIPKNAPNPEGAYAYLNAVLDKAAQEAFAIDMGYSPTISNAKLSPDLNKSVGFTQREIQKLIVPDYAFLTEQDEALKEWWDTELKA